MFILKQNVIPFFKYGGMFILQIVIVLSGFAQQTHTDSLEAQLATSHDNARVDILNELANANKSKEPLKAIKYADEAIQLSTDINYTLGIVIGYKFKGLAQGFNNQYETAIETLLLSNAVAEKIERLDIVAENCNNIASAYSAVLGNPSKALEYYLKTLKIYEQLNDKKGIAQALSGIGISYIAEKNFKDGLETHFKALAIFEELNDENDIRKMHVNIGKAYESNRDYVKALEFYNKALDEFKAANVPRGAAHTLYNIGNIHLIQGDADKAIKHLEEALALNEKSNHQSSIADCLTLLGEAYKRKLNYDKALDYFLKAEAVAIKLKKRESLSTAYKALANIYQSKNDFKNAFHYQELHTLYYDSIYSAEKSKQIAEMQTRFDSVNKQKEIELLKRDKLLNRIYLALAITTVVMLSIISFLVIKHQRLKIKKERELSEKESQIMEERKAIMETELQNRELVEQQLQSQIEFKNKELASYTLSVIQKNETLEDLKQRVEELKSTPEDQVKQKLSGLISLVNYSFQLDKDWENFKLHFEQVHQDFFKKLINQFPDLTANDLKVAALIKLNLDNRGIAAILNISQESAKVSRHRFRKKLNLPAEQNLLAFLNAIDQNQLPNQV